MSTNLLSDPNTNAIAANLGRMHELLVSTLHRSSLAQDSLSRGYVLEAIGALLNVEVALEEIQALHVAAVSLHRSQHSN